MRAAVLGRDRRGSQKGQEAEQQPFGYPSPTPRPSRRHRGQTTMATRTIKTPNGTELTLSSEELEPGDLALAEVLLELAAEQGSVQVTVSEDELARRLVAKGYDPHTGRRLH